MRVLVTGGAGYVGTVLSTRLATSGHDVVVFDRFIFGNALPRLPNLISVAGDVRDRQLLRAAMAGADAVVHLAFLSNDPQYCLPEAIARDVNVKGTRTVRDLAIEAGVARLVFMSSCSVYGKGRLRDARQCLIPEPLTAYASHKLQCEQILLGKTGVPQTLCIRAATVCGVSPRQRFDLLLNRMAAMAVMCGRIEVSGGARVRPYLPLNDLCQLIERWLGQSSPGRRWINAARGGADTVSETARKIAEWTGAQVVERDVADAADSRSYLVSEHDLQRMLGSTGGDALREAIHGLAEGLRRGDYVDPLDAPDYNNLKLQQRFFHAHA